MQQILLRSDAWQLIMSSLQPMDTTTEVTWQQGARENFVLPTMMIGYA